MSSNTANLPPYSEKHPSKETSAPSVPTRIAGTVQTCSIRDFQVDYLTIVRDSATTYHVALTVDPIPLYWIELASSSTEVGNIQIFPASDSELPAIAAARILATDSKSKSKGEPLATVCTSSPTQPNALWRPLTLTGGILSVGDYESTIPIVTVPGRAATPHQFVWRIRGFEKPFYRLWWEGPPPLAPSAMYRKDERGSEYVFATMARKTVDRKDNLVEIRRGGGMEFELSVILELFVILHLEKEKLS